MGKFIVLIVVLGLLLSVNVFAQEDVLNVDLATEVNDAFQAEEQQRQQLREEKRAFQALDTLPLETVVSSNPQQIAGDSDVSFLVTSIVLENVSLLTVLEQNRLTHRYKNRELSLSDINNLVREVTEYYVNKGYVTTRVYIVPQSLKTGELRLRVLEGILEDIVFDGTATESFFAFPFLKGRPFKLTHIDQGLEQLNRLNYHNAVLKIVPSTQNVGSGIAVIEDDKGNPGSASIRYDTYSNFEMDAAPASFDVVRENILSLNDQWSVSYYQRLKSREQFNNSFSVDVSVPFGYFTTEVSYSKYDYSTLVSGISGAFLTSGSTETSKAFMDVVLFRHKTGKTRFGFGVQSKDSVSYVEDVKSDVRSQKLVIFQSKFHHDFRVPLGNFSGTVTYHQGTGRLGASVDEDLTETSPRAQYKKVVVDSYWSKSFYEPVGVVSFRSSLKAQYANNVLYSSERLSIGGYSSIRGVTQTFQGDSGFYLRNEMSIPEIILFPRYASIFFAVDAGAAWKKGGEHVHNEDWRGVMTGSAVGLRWNKGLFSSEITYGWPTRFFGPFDKKQEPVTYASLTWELM